MAKGISSKTADGSALDFEAQLWAAADKMRGHMDASECYPRTFASAEGKSGGEFYTPQPYCGCRRHRSGPLTALKSSQTS